MLSLASGDHHISVVFLGRSVMKAADVAVTRITAIIFVRLEYLGEQRLRPHEMHFGKIV